MKDGVIQKTFSEFSRTFFNLPFYKALIFTLTYTLFVTPFVICLGFYYSAFH